MKKSNLNVDLVYDLIQAFKSIKSTKESAYFLQDILTAQEIKNLSIRLRIAKLLLKNLSQREISMQLNVSTSTVNKVNSWLNQKGDGFRKVISILPTKVDIPPSKRKGSIEFHLPEIIADSIQYGIANSQNNASKDLIENTENKKIVDKSMKKISDEYYKSKH
jgi:TrpR-related protein YerC/YecD